MLDLDPRRDVAWVPELVGAAPPSQRRLGRQVPAIVMGIAVALAIVALAAVGYLFQRLRTTESQVERSKTQLAGLQQRVRDTRQSVRFVHDLVILCSYDRRLCLDGVGPPSVVVAGILRRAGLDPARIPKTD